MAGSLVLIQETIVSSGISSVSLTGIDTSFDVYKLVLPTLRAMRTEMKFTNLSAALMLTPLFL